MEYGCGSPESHLSTRSKISLGTEYLSYLSPESIEDRQYDEERIFRELIPLNFELPINKDYNIDEFFEHNNNKSDININKQSKRGNLKKEDNLEAHKENFYPFKEESLCFIY